MTDYVVDASAFGPLFFNDEQDRLLAELPDFIAEEKCTAPQHWRLELANQIIAGLRRKRMTASMAEIAIAQIDQFPVEIDEMTNDRIAISYTLAARHGLTIYDAAYLELAVRLKLVLITYDKDLRKAARAEQIRILPLLPP